MPYKYICYDEDYKPLKITVDGEKITLEANAPVKGVVLDVAGEDAKWSDQCLVSPSSSSLFDSDLTSSADSLVNARFNRISCPETSKSSQPSG